MRIVRPVVDGVLMLSSTTNLAILHPDVYLAMLGLRVSNGSQTFLVDSSSAVCQSGCCKDHAEMSSSLSRGMEVSGG
jgi:hypothetical protein